MGSAFRDDVNTPLIAWIASLMALVTLAAILGVAALYFHYQERERQRKVVDAPFLSSEDAVAQQEAKLRRYEMIDPENNVVAIPIERAMELVVRELREAQRAENQGDER